ncbi:MAG: FKBP-type peptidyl-prolyl cis-trans isomerase [Opitutaceae bacterium]|nr:FKBP-type peptidyl-prolyl cis-trans isomerase [Opitutaceae bacterium]MBP9913278.1 FKBP-type peptidyl-prolyl cis-trans isomerase [Opitutaceae bacterium]
MRNFVVLVLAGFGLLTLALVVRSGMFARKNPGRPINSVMRLSMENAGIPEFSGEDAMILAKQYGNASRLPSGLLFVRRVAGTGDTPHEGQEVVVHYDGRLLNGQRFDSSYDRGTPYTFRLGAGTVIPGWEEAFLHMRKGEKRTLIIPYWLAYGLEGRPPKIPPRAALVFDVELLDIR